MGKHFLKSVLIVAISAALLVTVAVTVIAGPPDGRGPKTGEIWICPSVSTNNPNGMWVVGGHGAYYILKPGTASPNWPMILNPTGNLEMHAAHVEDVAQIRAGWGLYKDLPSYPYLDTGDGMAVVLDDGAEFISDEFGIDIAPMTMIHVVPSETPSYDEGSMTLMANLPLKSAVFW